MAKCIEYSDFNGTTDFNLHKLASINDDKQLINMDVIQSLEPGVYKLDNYYPKTCGEKQAIDVQTSQLGLNFSGGKGAIGKDGTNVDNNTYLRAFESTNLNYIHQL